MSNHILSKYRILQSDANAILNEGIQLLHPGMTENEIYQLFFNIISSRNNYHYWYHNVPIIIAIDEDTKVSISGKEYRPTNRILTDNSFITIDLSLGLSKCYGVLARSFKFINGTLLSDDKLYDELSLLFQVSQEIHHCVMNSNSEMTYGQLYNLLKGICDNRNVIQLDFRGNFGHLMVDNLDHRIFIESGDPHLIENNHAFSIEPHLTIPNSTYGFKMSNIYYKNNSSILNCLF